MQPGGQGADRLKMVEDSPSVGTIQCLKPRHQILRKAFVPLCDRNVLWTVCRATGRIGVHASPTVTEFSRESGKLWWKYLGLQVYTRLISPEGLKVLFFFHFLGFEASNGGVACGPSIQSRECNNTCLDCMWSDWLEAWLCCKTPESRFFPELVFEEPASNSLSLRT